MKKWILRGLLAFVVLLIVAVVVGLLVIDPIIRSKVESTTAQSVAQETHLAGANLKIMGQTLTLSGLTVANPAGYKAPLFLEMKECVIAVQPRSLLTDTVVVDSITIDGLHLTMQQLAAKNSLNDVLAAIQAQRAKNDAGTTGAQSKNLAIHKITLTNTQVTMSIDGLPGTKPIEFTATIPTMEIDDPMNPDGRMMKMADLSARVLMQIAQQAASDPQFTGAASAAISGSLKSVDQGLKSMQSTVQDTAKQLEQGVKGLGNLFGGKKDPPK